MSVLCDALSTQHTASHLEIAKGQVLRNNDFITGAVCHYSRPVVPMPCWHHAIAEARDNQQGMPDVEVFCSNACNAHGCSVALAEAEEQ